MRESKKAYHKVPSKGLPRITKVNNLAEDRRFNLIDPAGNRLIIGQKHALSMPTEQDPPSRFATAFETAYQLAYAKDKPADAAKVLDLVFSKDEEATLTLQYKAFVLRADIAASMDEIELMSSFIEKIDSLSLTGAELEEVVAATARLDELKASFGE
ncbi:hypothetical protein NST07_10025 [Paenibacillus sp. FSL L8-0340]|uniref:hypothetical protein n=1 Tax=Paenibacillus sp. FSL L8-0340 TaxID=2954685 RepID=UPI003157FF0F